MQYLGAISKTTEWSWFPSKANHSIYSNPSLCPTTTVKEAEVEHFYEYLQDVLELTTTTTKCTFHHRELEYKSRKPRDTWSNSQVWPWSTKWSMAKTNRIFPREHTGHSKHPLSTTQEATQQMDITRRPILKSDWLYFLQLKMEKFYTVSKNKTGSRLWLRSRTPYCKIQT